MKLVNAWSTCCWYSARPACAIRMVWEELRISVMKRSFQAVMNEFIPITASAGHKRGRMVRKNTWNVLVPSIKAAVQSEAGVAQYCLMMKTPNNMVCFAEMSAKTRFIAILALPFLPETSLIFENTCFLDRISLQASQLHSPFSLTLRQRTCSTRYWCCGWSQKHSWKSFRAWWEGWVHRHNHDCGWWRTHPTHHDGTQNRDETCLDLGMEWQRTAGRRYSYW